MASRAAVINEFGVAIGGPYNGQRISHREPMVCQWLHVFPEPGICASRDTPHLTVRHVVGEYLFHEESGTWHWSGEWSGA